MNNQSDPRISRREKLLRCLDAPDGMNRVYLGGRACARLCRLLGIKYGRDSLTDAIKHASDFGINKVYDDMGDAIESVWCHGLAEGREETAEVIWVRLGEYRTSKPDNPEGWVRYVRGCLNS